MGDYDMLILGLAGVLLGTACLLVGRLLDPTWRAKQERRWLRRNTFVLGLVSNDKKTVNRQTVNLESSRIELSKDKIIIIDKQRIYREDKPQEGFFVSKRYVKWDEGVPTIYIYEDSLLPADFNTEPSKVSPQEIGSSLVAFVQLQIAMAYTAIKRTEMYFFIVMGLCLIILAISWFSYGEAQATHLVANQNLADTRLIMDKFGILENQSINATSAPQSQTIVIKG